MIGETEDNKEFAGAVLQRFANPFIAHKLTAIALNSVSKFGVRVLPTAIDCKEKNGCFPKAAALSLAALIEYYKKFSPNDSDAEAAEFIKNSDVDAIVCADIFGADISEMADNVKTAYAMIESGQIREGIRWAIS